MATRNLINITDNVIVLTDLNGLTIAAHETVDGTVFGDEMLRNSNSVVAELLNGHLNVSDGSFTYSDGKAIDLIRGVPTRVSSSGAQIVTASDQPPNTNTYYTGASDDVANNVLGAGNQFLFNVGENESITVDAVFMTDIWIKEGEIYYSANAALGSYVTVQIICPAGHPFPAPSVNGNYDIVNGAPVANNTNTGQYFILTTEVLIETYINKYPLLAFGRGEINSPVPAQLPAGWLIRMTVFNASTTGTLSAGIVLATYR